MLDSEEEFFEKDLLALHDLGWTFQLRMTPDQAKPQLALNYGLSYQSKIDLICKLN
jgi:hypothetical protein